MKRIKLNSEYVQLAILQILLLASVVVYLDIDFIRDRFEIYEAGLLFIVSLLLLFSIVLGKSSFALTRFEYCYLVFIVYTIMRVYFSQNPDISAVSNIAFPVFIYCSLRSLINEIVIIKVIAAVKTSLYVLFLLYVLIWCLGDSIKVIFLPNASVFAILLSCQLLFLISTQPRNYFLIILGTLMLAFTNGRSGWVGFLISLLLVSKTKIKNVGIALLFIAIPFLVAYKSSSSSGRMLIYKISISILKDNSLFGIGTGQFAKVYNDYQGEYFKSAGIDSAEAMLADNSQYAFNDILQLLVENGIVGFLLFGVSMIFLFRETRESPYNTVLICVAVSSFVFYPFHVFPIIFFCVLCLALSNKSKVSTTNSNVFRMILISVGCLLTIHFWMNIQYRAGSYKANQFAQAGFKLKSVEEYEKLNQSYIQDGKTMFHYAKELNSINELQKAYVVLQRLKNYYSTHEVYRYSGEICVGLKLYKQAERDYMTAIYRVPNRMTSRFSLFTYYLLMNDTLSARYWGNSILSMPIKVPSVHTMYMQEKVSVLLQKLS